MLGVRVYDLWMITTTTKPRRNTMSTYDEVHGPSKISQMEAIRQAASKEYQKNQAVINAKVDAETRKLNAEAALMELAYERELACKKETGSPKSDHWEDDQEFPVDDWIAEVQAGDTRLGYRDWVARQIEFELDV